MIIQYKNKKNEYRQKIINFIIIIIIIIIYN